MPTSRTLAILLVVLVGLAGCNAGASSGEVGTTEGDLGARSAGIQPGTLDEEGVLLLVNDRATTLDVLEARTQLPPVVATDIINFRDFTQGPTWYTSIDELDALPNTDEAAFRHLLTDARANGYVEAPGFDPPTAAKIAVPSNLGRPPTAADVTVEAGFDGKPAAEAASLVRGRLTNVVHPSNERFVGQTIHDNHKAFTLAVGNLFAQGSPHAAFARSLGADTLMLIGTASAVNPTILVAGKAGTTSYYARGQSGQYELIAKPTYPILMRARIRLETGAANDPGQGVRVFYPAWSAKVLAAPTAVVTEGP